MEKKNKCRQYFSGCVSVDDENSVHYYNLTENSFTRIQTDGKVPLALDSEQGLLALKGMNEDGITVEIRKSGAVKKLELENETSSVLSACFLDDGSLAILQMDEESSVKRSYIVSVSDKKFSEWTGYKVSEENTRDLFARLLSLGAVIERPAALQCYGQNIYLISHRIFSDMMNVVVSKLNRKGKELRYITGYHPVSNSGRVSVHFQEKNETLFVYRGNQLMTVKGLEFPVTRVFDEPGEMLFFKDSKTLGTYLYFVPDNKAPGESDIRKVRF